MAALLLVKHAMPEIVPDVPSREWLLGDVGRGGSRVLAGVLRRWSPASVFASVETKASETGSIVATELGLPFQTRPGLHENDRTGLAFLGTAEYDALFRQYFTRQDARIIGEETAGEACVRFTGAVNTLSREASAGSVVVVAHGTVISLFVASVAGVDAFPLWKRLGLPSIVALDRADMTIEAIVDSVV